MKLLKPLLTLTLLFFFVSFNLVAGEHIGIGTHFGIQHDVGSLETFPYETLKPQMNTIFGVSVKSDYKYLFLQIGIDKTFLLFSSDVTGSNTKLTKSNIQYLSIPVYAGINFSIKDRGKFFLGIGGTYISGSGTITTTDGNLNFSTITPAYGFLTGLQISVTNDLDFTIELEYLQGSSNPVTNTNPTKTWKDFPINYNGNRYYFGFRYYAI